MPLLSKVDYGNIRTCIVVWRDGQQLMLAAVSARWPSHSPRAPDMLFCCRDLYLHALTHRQTSIKKKNHILFTYFYM